MSEHYHDKGFMSGGGGLNIVNVNRMLRSCLSENRLYRRKKKTRSLGKVVHAELLRDTVRCWMLVHGMSFVPLSGKGCTRTFGVFLQLGG